jgi:hypothetical protein
MHYYGMNASACDTSQQFYIVIVHISPALINSTQAAKKNR